MKLPPGIYFKNGKYQARVYVGTEDRVSHTVSRSFSTLAEAVAWKAEMEKGPKIRRKTTVGAYLASWLEQRRPFLHYSTYKRQRSIVKAVQKSFLAAMKLGEVEPKHILRFLAEATKGKAPATWHNYRRVLRAAFYAAEEEGLLVRNPAAGRVLKLPRPVQVRPHGRLIEEQAQKLWEACDHEPYGAVIQTLLVTGARLSEVLGLQWQDIDIERRVITIRRVLEKGGKSVLIAPTKSLTSTREIMLPEVLIPKLLAWKHEDNIPWVFHTKNGTPLLASNIYHRTWGRLKKRLKLNCTIHGLRRTYLSTAAALQVNPKVVQRQAGHSSWSQTADYTDPTYETQQRMADLIAERLSMGRRLAPVQESAGEAGKEEAAEGLTKRISRSSGDRAGAF